MMQAVSAIRPPATYCYKLLGTLHFAAPCNMKFQGKKTGAKLWPMLNLYQRNLPVLPSCKSTAEQQGVSFQELPIDGNAAKREEMTNAAVAPRFPRFLLTHSTLAL